MSQNIYYISRLAYVIIPIESNDINVHFRYDARNKGKPTLWSEDEPKGFGNRAHFKAQSPNAKLYLDNITFNEGGIFRCRVDFQTAQTRNSLFNLTVIGNENDCFTT